MKTDYYSGDRPSVLIMVYDISNPASPKLVGKTVRTVIIILHEWSAITFI